MPATYHASNLALIAYAIASVLFLKAFPRGKSQNLTNHVAFGFLVSGTILISYAVFGNYHGMVWAKSAGLLLVVSISWLTVLVHSGLGVYSLGTFVTPIVTFILLLQFFFAPSGAEVSQAFGPTGNILNGIHVLAAVLGQAFAICATAISMIYLIQHRALKKRRLDQLSANTPALDRLEVLLIGSIWAGFLFFSASLVTGSVFTRTYIDTLPLNLGLKAVWSLTVWGWYLAILIVHNVLRWPIIRIALMSLSGFFLLLVSFFGLGFFRSLGGV